MEDFVRKTRGVRDINSLPLDTNHELDIVSDVKGKIYIKILNRYKELLFDNGTEQWVIDMLNNLEVDVGQLKEDILDVEQSLSELPMITDKLEAVETKLAQINTLFAQMQIDVQGLDLRTAELEREVVQLALKDQELLDKLNNLDLGKITTLYSNSIDFGDYDYSGNPNLMRVIKASDFRRDGNSDVVISDVEYNSIRLTSQGVNRLSAYTETNVPSLVAGKTYTISAKIKFEEGSTGDINKLRVSYRQANSGAILINARSDGAEVGKEIIIKGTATVDYVITDVTKFYLTIDTDAGAKINGSVIVSDIKIEEGSTATPYQPNLLDAPYYLSKVALGENLADPAINFPIKTSAYRLYGVNMLEDFKIGQRYTLTMKATKPATQTFVAYNGETINFGNLTLVEGLKDVWSLTFTPTYLQPNFHRDLRIYQYPESTVGACQIDWLKIEKGDTRTPNISHYKYVGINPVASKNPNEYQWIPLAKPAETVDTRLTKTISTYDTVNALQNNRLTALESKVVDTTWQNVSVTEPFTSVTQPQVKKQNGIVYMRGTISNGTGDCFTLPEGFRPPEGAYEMQFRLPCRSANASDYATMYVRPSGLCSIVGVSGTKPIFLSGIIFSTT